MKVGLLGGSFNPVHNGHMRLAIEVWEKTDLDRLDFLPAADPPHKRNKDLLPFEFRCRLLELALEGFKGYPFFINQIENQRIGPSYTLDTLNYLKMKEPKNKFFFILGSNDFLHLPEWHAWKELLSSVNFIVVGRQGQDIEWIEDFLQKETGLPNISKEEEGRWKIWNKNWILYLDIPRLDISSSLLRDKLSKGQSLAYLVPKDVEEMLLTSRTK